MLYGIFTVKILQLPLYLTSWLMQAVEAMRLGNKAANFVSAAFPDPMELKFERIAQPFMLLHVNRCSRPCYTVCELLKRVCCYILYVSPGYTGLDVFPWKPKRCHRTSHKRMQQCSSSGGKCSMILCA